MRLFVAIELPDDLKAAAAGAINHLGHALSSAHAGIEVRWVKPSHLHVTLAFLGARADEDLPAITSALEKPFDIAPFAMELGSFGAFPPGGRPRVIWVGIKGGAEPAAALQREVSSRLQNTGYEPERRGFSPHVTVARVKDARGSAQNARRLIKQDRASIGAFMVERVTLFESHLSPAGSTYEPLLRVPLQG